jgi:thiamine pyrophosphate-dependent acetolactate synthase large subunit-like protein
MLEKQAIAGFFTKNNIQYVFQLPGLHILPLNEELTHEKTFG